MQARLRLGAIGVGAIFQRYLAAAEHVGNVEFVALADKDRERLSSYAGRGRVISPNADALMGLRLDGILVLTPNALHGSLCAQAAEHGQAVLCEKPLATTVSEATRVVQQAQAAGARLEVAMHCRYFPEILLFMRELREPIVRFQHRYAENWLRAPKWYFDPLLSGGGALLDIGVNQLDWLCALVGDLNPVDASCDLGGERVELEATVTWTFATGEGTTHFSWRAARDQKYTRLETASGRVYILDHIRHTVACEGRVRRIIGLPEYEGVLRDFVANRRLESYSSHAPVRILELLRGAYLLAGLPFLRGHDSLAAEAR